MTKKLSNLSEAILEMAEDQFRSGIMDKATHEKITFVSLANRFCLRPSRSAEDKSASCGSGQT